MSTHRNIDRICCIILALTLILTVLFVSAKGMSSENTPQPMGYENRLFDTGIVHTLDIVMDDWDSFISTCTNEEYSPCSVAIDGESFRNVGIRAKGNTSLTQVESYGNNRYSFKIEFDHYENSQSYYGLDKLSLNNIIQDNTYMKDYLSYQMMAEFGAVSPLCSYVYIRVNGEDWGLYLAVEGVEESFLQRNYGADYGELYKPESQNFGGRDIQGNKEGFKQRPENAEFGIPDMPEDDMEFGDAPDTGDFKVPGNFDGFGGFGGSASSDVSLIYTDDDYSSYSNIFDNAKTDITNQDKDRLISSLESLNLCRDIDSTVDVENVIRYFVVHNFVCNFDSYTGSIVHNYYLYEADGKLSMIPWDYNLAFGGFMGAQDATALINYPIDTPVSGGTVDSRPMLAWIFSNDEYTRLYHQYFAEFISSYFDSGTFSSELERVQALIAPYVEKDPTSFCTYEDFQKGVAALKDFCLLRAQSVSGQLDGSIPSTSDEQAENTSALVDGSNVNIADMGTMNNDFGGRNQGGPPDIPEGGEAPDIRQQIGVEERHPGEADTLDTSGLAMVGVCALVLIMAIVAVMVYRKKA
ncbi:CotH kinase family protein [Acutalibacter sp. 1XD8-36]|uniref:CotH kinase family protein n=1 Tax=Acutalibacter sp. 1XD8-36 TaxID=2320852 RepID=UPI001412A922|nr:CotH kinase family protein [Acutalibacter sp. 1XD8-36]NBJ88103.1 spore coat protein CotH [Acutalibacter sp. 1XD8-36]